MTGGNKGGGRMVMHVTTGAEIFQLYNLNLAQASQSGGAPGVSRNTGRQLNGHF